MGKPFLGDEYNNLVLPNERIEFVPTGLQIIVFALALLKETKQLRITKNRCEILRPVKGNVDIVYIFMLLHS